MFKMRPIRNSYIQENSEGILQIDYNDYVSERMNDKGTNYSRFTTPLGRSVRDKTANISRDSHIRMP